jgi:hypothetical protein
MSEINSCLRERGLSEIPSELIEPYLVAMLSVELECIEFTPTQERLDEAKANLKGVERFVSRFCGIHARYATSNVYDSFYRMTLDQAKRIIKAANKEKFGK